MYVNQFRSGMLLRQYLVAISNNADSCFISGERTFMGFANYGEDLDGVIALTEAAGTHVSMLSFDCRASDS